jgi:hypothetical protein
MGRAGQAPAAGDGRDRLIGEGRVDQVTAAPIQPRPDLYVESSTTLLAALKFPDNCKSVSECHRTAAKTSLADDYVDGSTESGDHDIDKKMWR